jgi:hypothetical protein
MESTEPAGESPLPPFNRPLPPFHRDPPGEGDKAAAGYRRILEALAA